LIRGRHLEKMSDYLVREIANSGNISVTSGVKVVDGSGARVLEYLVLENCDDKSRTTVDADALFVLIGSVPHTDSLGAEVARDRWGFILTGADLPRDTFEGSNGHQAPLMFETSLPGVFAIGDVRHGSVPRVASAVGAGAIVVRMIHDYLAATHQAPGENTGG
jgi:thioredoxin reductase (NADPH)